LRKSGAPRIDAPHLSFAPHQVKETLDHLIDDITDRNRYSASNRYRGDQPGIHRFSSCVNVMPRKPQPKPDNPEQFKRFTDLAREVGADEQGKDFERVFDKIAKHPSAPKKPKRSK
jgi:hypothetical protein